MYMYICTYVIYIKTRIYIGRWETKGLDPHALTGSVSLSCFSNRNICICTYVYAYICICIHIWYPWKDRYGRYTKVEAHLHSAGETCMYAISFSRFVLFLFHFVCISGLLARVRGSNGEVIAAVHPSHPITGRSVRSREMRNWSRDL